MKYKKIEINGDGWLAVHDLEERIPFSLSLNHSTRATATVPAGKITESPNHQITLMGIVIGDLTESISLPEKAVQHEFMDIEGYSVDTKSTIPFGSEPVIVRNFEYLPNIVKVTTDVQIRRSTVAENLEIDSLKLDGDWKRCAIINLTPEKPASKKVKWINLKKSNSKTASKPDSFIYDSETTFHIFLLEDKAGNRIEIGAGFDLWRWNQGAGDNEVRDPESEVSETETTVFPPKKGRFTIENTENGIIVRRQIISSEEECELHAQIWRFNWYLSWGAEDGAPELEHFRTLELEHSSTPELPNSPTCFHAKATRNQLRKAVRAEINKLDDDTLCLPDIEPHLCSNPSHIARPGKEGLQHWDMTDIIDFWFWANRQLLKSDSKLIIRPPKGSIFEELPSFRRMRKRS